jgi:hypothetical protein
MKKRLGIKDSFLLAAWTYSYAFLLLVFRLLKRWERAKPRSGQSTSR